MTSELSTNKPERAGKADASKALQFAVAIYVVLFLAKLSAYFLTGVMVLLAESLHTLSDIVISGFLLLAARWSRRPADALYMFGYGRAQNAAALVAATLFISFTSFKLYEEAIPRLFSSASHETANLAVAWAVILGSMAVAALPIVPLLRQRGSGAAAKAQLTELINDELGLIAALIGMGFVYFGMPSGDPAAAIAVATLIAFNALGLFRENLSMLLGRAPEPSVLERINHLARSVAGVEAVENLRAEYVGPGTLHAGMRLRVGRGVPIEEAERIAERVRRIVHEGMPESYCYIEIGAGDSAEQRSSGANHPNPADLAGKAEPLPGTTPPPIEHEST